MNYEDFKTSTLDIEKSIRVAEGVGAVEFEYMRGFNDAMQEAREIFMRLEEKTQP